MIHDAGRQRRALNVTKRDIELSPVSLQILLYARQQSLQAQLLRLAFGGDLWHQLHRWRQGIARPRYTATQTIAVRISAASACYCVRGWTISIIIAGLAGIACGKKNIDYDPFNVTNPQGGWQRDAHERPLRADVGDHIDLHHDPE